MSISNTTAEKLAALNVNLEVAAEASYSSTTVEKLVRIVSSNNLHIKIHAGSYSSTGAREIRKDWRL